MAQAVGALRIDFLANTADFLTGTKKVQGQLAFLSKSVAGVGAAFAGFLAVTSVRDFSRQIEQSIGKLDDIAKTSQRLGLATGALQELRHAAELSGIEVGTFDMAMQRFTRRTAEAAQGTGEAKGALKELGIELRDGQGNLRSSEDLFTDVADALQKVGNDSDQLRLAFKLFDSEGARLIQMLEGGSVALNEMRRDARDLGLVFDDALIRQAEAAGDKLDTLWKVIDANVVRTFAGMADELVQLVGVFADFVQWTAKASVELLKFFGVIDRGTLEKLLKERKELAQSVANPNIDLVVGQVQLLSDAEIERRKDRIAELDEMIQRFNLRAAAAGQTPAGGGGLRDPLGLGGGDGGVDLVTGAMDQLGAATREAFRELELLQGGYNDFASEGIQDVSRVLESMGRFVPSIRNIMDLPPDLVTLFRDLSDTKFALETEKIAVGLQQEADQLQLLTQLREADNATRRAAIRLQEIQIQLGPQAAQQLRDQVLAVEQLREQVDQMSLGGGLSFSESFISELEKMKSATQNISGQMGASLAQVFGPGGTFQRSIGDAAARMIVFGETGEDAIKRIGQQILGSIISSLVQMGVQMAINWVIGQTLGAAATAAGVGQAGILAAAWAPAAALASLATVGANAAAATTAVASTIALTKGMAVVTAAVPGLAGGAVNLRGPGTGTSDSMLARLSAGESVITAQGTRNFGPALAAINAGLDPAAMAAGRGLGREQAGGVTFINATGIPLEPLWLSPSEVELRIAQGVQRGAPGAVAEDLAGGANTLTGKALTRNYQVRPQRS